MGSGALVRTIVLPDEGGKSDRLSERMFSLFIGYGIYQTIQAFRKYGK
jgi:hypothetical protein